MNLDTINRNCCRYTKQKIVSTQLDTHDYDRLREVADSMVMGVSSLVRGILLSFLDEFESHEGDVMVE